MAVAYAESAEEAIKLVIHDNHIYPDDEYVAELMPEYKAEEIQLAKEPMVLASYFE